jgi:acetyltransferase-like isoleucine patch superfamily enzyme
MIKLFRRCYSYMKYFIKLIIDFLMRFFNFVLPNIVNILKNRIILSDFPKFNQITLCEGNGIVKIGNNCTFGFKLGGFHRNGSIELQARYRKARINIGNNVATNNNIMLMAANYIEIGDSTLIGQYVTIMDHEAHGIHPSKRRVIGEIGTVMLGKNVWVGNNVTILKNTIIGDNTIVATGAVVSGKFPANVIIGGIPAKIIKSITNESYH